MKKEDSRLSKGGKKMVDENISVLLDEKRVFKPGEEFVNQTHVKQWMDKHNIKDLDELHKKAEDWNGSGKRFQKNLLNGTNHMTKLLIGIHHG